VLTHDGVNQPVFCCDDHYDINQFKKHAHELGLIVKPASKAEVATDLGFPDVPAMRRWETEMGQQIADLEQRLRTAIDERDRFRWHGRRMQMVLERAETFIRGGPLDKDHPTVSDLLLAIGVMCGKAVDWDHRLDGWFPEPEPEKAEAKTAETKS
jgi:hypothetical protein